MIKMGLNGLDSVMFKLRNLGTKVPENGRKVMHRAADRIVRQAKINAPRLEGNLEDSIRKVVSYGERGRLQIDIVMGGTINGVNVDEYALEMHENYEAYRPGPGTREKMAQNPGAIIGSKFIERAVDEEREKLMNAMIAGIRETIRT